MDSKSEEKNRKQTTRPNECYTSDDKIQQKKKRRNFVIEKRKIEILSLTQHINEIRLKFSLFPH